VIGDHGFVEHGQHHDLREGEEAREELEGPHRMMLLLLVMAAGAVGVAMRYGLGALITERLGDGFPWSTLIVNVTGAFAMGVLVAALEHAGASSDVVRPAIGIGLLGGYTTFSAFALDAVSLAEDGRVARAVTYVVATNVVGIAALVAGLAGTRGVLAQ
jgi:CrcB protein